MNWAVVPRENADRVTKKAQDGAVGAAPGCGTRSGVSVSRGEQTRESVLRRPAPARQDFSGESDSRPGVATATSDSPIGGPIQLSTGKTTRESTL